MSSDSSPPLLPPAISPFPKIPPTTPEFGGKDTTAPTQVPACGDPDTVHVLAPGYRLTPRMGWNIQRLFGIAAAGAVFQGRRDVAIHEDGASQIDPDSQTPDPLGWTSAIQDAAIASPTAEFHGDAPRNRIFKLTDIPRPGRSGAS